MNMNVFENIGSTLEILEMPYPDHVKPKEIRSIQKYCRKFTRISIHTSMLSVFDDTDALAECLASYKEQLEYATVRHMKQEDLRNVVASCTKARFNFELDHRCSGNTVDNIRIFGKQLERVRLGEYCVFEGADQSVWDACPNIREI